jgi:hypothetical protein
MPLENGSLIFIFKPLLPSHAQNSKLPKELQAGRGANRTEWNNERIRGRTKKPWWSPFSALENIDREQHISL